MHFSSNEIPEIHDVWIATGQRRLGYGKILIKYLEDYARAQRYKTVGLGIGLYADYGAAQKLYALLGYVPDMHGITYKGQSVIPGHSYPIDDSLILWMTKGL